MPKRTPGQVIQSAIDIQEQCIPAGRGPGHFYMVGMLNGLKYGKYAISGGTVSYEKTGLYKKVRHKAVKKVK